MNFFPLEKQLVENCTQNSLYLERYSDDEVKVLRKLEILFADWYKAFVDEQDNSGNIIRNYTAADMSFDGFYPGYMRQKTKLLFIGREGRGISGTNYLDCLFEAIKNNYIDNKTLNRHEFHRRMLYINYALENGETRYNIVPFADDISPDFGTEKISYAFMNLSKFSNEKETFNSDYELIDKAIEVSTKNRNFIKDEITILDPDIVFTMNMKKYFDKLGDIKAIDPELHTSSWIKPYEIVINNKKVFLIDTCHFSYVLKEERDFFDPIMKVIKMYRERFNLKCLAD